MTDDSLLIGIFGNARDAHCEAIAREVGAQGHRVVNVDAGAFSRGVPQALDDDGLWYGGLDLLKVDAWCLRYVLLPIPRSYQREDEHRLFKEWWVDFMHEREAFGYQLSLLLTLERMGIPIVNPAEHGSVIQLKPLQLHHARDCGLRTPRTLITNDPKAVLRFAEGVRDVVYKPSLGGGLCRPFTHEDRLRLPMLAASPVTFQERVRGDMLRLTFVGGKLVSSVSVESGELDYRADPAYQCGDTGYSVAPIPEEIQARCRKLLDLCGLSFSGVDLIRTAEGEYVFLEANSSPAFLDIENKIGHPVTASLVSYLVTRARARTKQPAAARASEQRSFISYALPLGRNQYT